MNKQVLIENYLISEQKVTGAVMLMLKDKILRYNDISDEFCQYLEQRNYDFEHPLTVEGYTAKQIHELAPFLEGIGVYNFLITLRENPERAKKYIEEGFPRG